MLYLKLFHGRKDPKQDMDDWGEQGPWIGPFQGMAWTYGDKRDASHQGSRITGYVHQSRNRGDRNNSRGDRRARGRMGRRR